MNESKKELWLALVQWEQYDPDLTPAQNFLELQIQMGFLDQAQEGLQKIMDKSQKGL